MAQTLIPHPPKISGYEVTHNKTLRFTSNAAFNGQITYQNLLDTILFLGSGSAAYDMFYMVRLKRVRVWAIPIVSQSLSVTVVFDGTTAGSQGDRIVHTDSSMGIEPAYISCSPKPKTLASMFQISSANNCFFLDIPAGAVVDVDLTFKSATDGTSVNSQNVSSGTTNGSVAYRGLDGLAKATTAFVVPIGLNWQ
jgi:hypothetical protein